MLGHVGGDEGELPAHVFAAHCAKKAEALRKTSLLQTFVVLAQPRQFARLGLLALSPRPSPRPPARAAMSSAASGSPQAQPQHSPASPPAPKGAQPPTPCTPAKTAASSASSSHPSRSVGTLPTGPESGSNVSIWFPWRPRT